MMPVMDTLRDYVRRERKERRISQKAMAEYLGVALRTYTEWERGKTKTIKDQLLKLILERLQTPPEKIAELLGVKKPRRATIEEMWRDEARRMSDQEIEEELIRIRQRRTK